jgi:hypothetical protein
LFKQHARHVCTAVGYLFGTLHSPTGGQDSEPEEAHVPAAKADGRIARIVRVRVWVGKCMLEDGETVWG